MTIYTKPDIDASPITSVSDFSEHLLDHQYPNKKKGRTDPFRSIQIPGQIGWE